MLKQIATTLILILLSACTSLQAPEQAGDFVKQPWSQRQAALQQFDQWHIKGAFSVQQQAERHIANYDWQQNDRDYHIDIHSSLGLYSVKIQGSPNRVTLYESNQQPLSASSADALLYQRLGWPLPIANLSYWVRGLPAPTDYQGKFDRYGHLIQLEQQGWQIKFSRYTHLGQLDLPQVLDISGHQLIIRVVIKKWSQP